MAWSYEPGSMNTQFTSRYYITEQDFGNARSDAAYALAWAGRYRRAAMREPARRDLLSNCAKCISLAKQYRRT